MANIKYELHGNPDWDIPGEWVLVSAHRSREAAIKAAVKNGPDYRACRIHTVQIENLPTSLTDPQRAEREKKQARLRLQRNMDAYRRKNTAD